MSIKNPRKSFYRKVPTFSCSGTVRLSREAPLGFGSNCVQPEGLRAGAELQSFQESRRQHSGSTYDVWAALSFSLLDMESGVDLAVLKLLGSSGLPA